MAAQGQSWQKDAADQNFDYMFKLLIIGNSSVGKTSFLFRYADDSFTSAFVSTVGIDFKVKTVFRQDKRVKLQIWVRILNFTILCEIGSYCKHITVCGVGRFDGKPKYKFDIFIYCVGHCRAGTVSHDHDCLLQRRHGIHPHV